MKWLVCCLNDENYTEAGFKFTDSLESAKKICIQNVMNVFDISKEEVMSGLDEKDFDKDENSCLSGLKISFGDPDSFFVNHIIPVDVKEGDFICVWHHAYDGVEFWICKTGTYEECKKAMYQDVKKTMDEIDCTCDYDTGGQVVLDTDTEWLIWDIISCTN